MSKLPTNYQDFIYKRTYSRYIDGLNRRETWGETINRYWNFFKDRCPAALQATFADACTSIEALGVMPSMRSLWTAGDALDRENIAGYNCAYTVIDDVRSFAEILYILMNGTGVGFSVERQYISKLPEIPYYLPNVPSKDHNIVVEDSKLGWAEGFHKLIMALYLGHRPTYDLSKLRPKGARLKTFGGRASGPEPLKQLFDFTINLFIKARGRKLNSIECYDLVCFTANCVVVGGVRRSATINLSNFSDQRMRHAKDGQFWIDNPQRALSNNSVAYTETPDMVSFMEEWLNLTRSGSGERGIVNRVGLKKTAHALGRDATYDFGVNPCGEIVLRPKQFCNLTEVIVRPEDNLKTLGEKVSHAVLLGCLQSTLTDFNFLSEEWKKNSEEERLLGVSLTGLCDHPILGKTHGDAKRWLVILQGAAEFYAADYAKVLGIEVPKAVTCVKPSGTVSQLTNASSGIHPRFSKYYVRRVRVTRADPIAQMLIDKGVPWHPEVGQTKEECNTVVFEYPIESPDDSVFVSERNAIEQLEYWLMLKKYWCHHNPSCTIYVKDHEWLEVGAWVYKHWDDIGGLSFLPFDGGNYPLMPYEAIEKEQYEALLAAMPVVDFDDLVHYEKEDKTEGSREFACQGGVCEIA